MLSPQKRHTQLWLSLETLLKSAAMYFHCLHVSSCHFESLQGFREALSSVNLLELQEKYHFFQLGLVFTGVWGITPTDLLCAWVVIHPSV